MPSTGTVALAGNPNCGKTSLFNRLTGARQRVGNWPGVTVERKEGGYRHERRDVVVVDLPGVYSLDSEGSDALDSQIALSYLLSGRADAVVNVVDASNLERNLYLTTELLDLGVPMLVALTMADVAATRGVRVDATRLGELLGCPVAIVNPRRGRGTTRLRDAIERQLQGGLAPTGARPSYPKAIDDAIAALLEATPQPPTASAPGAPRWTALRRLQEQQPSGTPAEVEALSRARQALGDDVDIVVADSRYGFVRALVEQVAEKTGELSAPATERVDRIVLNRWLGIPIFLAAMYALFMVTINVGGAFIDFFDLLAGAIFVDGFGALLSGVGAPDWLRVLLADGAGGGVQIVATFIPIVGMLFLFLSALEDSGYMARAAFVMDRVMRVMGLPGKSFVPLLLGFGCNVPAIMATRTLESRRDRLITIMMNPFMSCGARLPVYALFAAAFFPTIGQHVVFGLYLIGMAAAVFTGLVLKHTLLRGASTPFVMELPPYHVPAVQSVLLHTWQRLKGFVFGAGKVIVAMVVVLSLLGSIGTDGSFGHDDTEGSLLGAASRAVTPALAPIGVDDENWPATVGVVTGVFAKEALVGTLDSLYGSLADPQAAEQQQFAFWSDVGAAFATIPTNLAAVAGTLLDPLGLSVGEIGTRAAAAEQQGVAGGTFGEMARRFDGGAGAFAYLLFVLLYFPCAAATGAIYRETTPPWTLFAVCWTTALAYAAATLFFQAATFGRDPAAAGGWIVGVLAALALAIAAMRLLGARPPSGLGPLRPPIVADPALLTRAPEQAG